MSREVRRVPVGWQHPTTPNQYWAEQETRRWRDGRPASRLHPPEVRFVGLTSPSLSVAQREWDEEYAQWKAGTHKSLAFYRAYHSRDGWVYPKTGEREFHPIRFFDETGNTVVEEMWVEDVDVSEERFFADNNWPRPDDSDECMPDFDVPDDELGWCLYETVSEGTPVTPVFATAEELIDHLATIGQDYEQVPMRRTAAEALVREGSTLGSFLIIGNNRMLRSDLDADIIAGLGGES